MHKVQSNSTVVRVSGADYVIRIDVRYCNEWEEYQVEAYVQDCYYANMTYYTDNKLDAIATAARMRDELAQNIREGV